MEIDTHPLGRPLLAIFCYNNGTNARETLLKVPVDRCFDVVVNDDGSTDDTPRYLAEFEFPILRNEVNRGIGFALKKVIHYAWDNKYRVLAVMAGNNKDDPRQVERLLQPIYEEGHDYVQGSRRLPGGRSENLPLSRRVMVPIHALIFHLLTGFPCTDALNGFRAYKVSIFFDDPRINVWQDWLDGYEFETYVHYKVLKLGYKVKEVPVTKSYAHFTSGMKYSHIRPIVDWWNIMRPLVYLALGLRD